MSSTTKIAWTQSTWNVVSGCTKISPGCEHCYITRTPPFRIAGRVWDGDGIGATTKVQLHPERYSQPLHWRRPRRVFVCSLADLFHDDVPDHAIASVFATMAACERHTFQVLTKRPARMRSLLSRRSFRDCISATAGAWPLPNVWLGVTAEDQVRADQRVPILLATPAAVRWVSCEPLLGPVDLRWCGGIDALEPDWMGGPGGGTGAPHPLLNWVVCGGETGPGARPMNPRWAKMLRDQCVDAGVPYFFKQQGEWAPAPWKLEPEPGETPEEYRARSDAHGATHAFTGGYYRDGDRDVEGFMPLGHRPWSSERDHQAPAGAVGMRRAGKRLAGRVLDGRTWDEYPEAIR